MNVEAVKEIADRILRLPPSAFNRHNIEMIVKQELMPEQMDVIYGWLSPMTYTRTGEIAKLCGLKSGDVSKQLSIMEKLGLVESRRVSKKRLAWRRIA